MLRPLDALFAAGSKLEAELSKPEVDGLIKGKLEEVMRAGDQRMCALGFHAVGILKLGCTCNGLLF